MISILLLILAGICNAVMDALQFKFRKSIFKNKYQPFWNPSLSWEMKWDMEHWQKTKEYKERFPGSSTIFVMFTDAWHLFKYLMITCFALSIVFYQPIVNWYVDIVIMYCVFTCTFELFYSKILVYGNKNR